MSYMETLGIISKEPLLKGWSCDTKYCVKTAEGTKYLLRVTPEEKSASRADMFCMQKKAASLGVPMCVPVAFGKCGEGVYSVHTWINGEDAEECIPRLSSAEQYEYGLEAGRILKTIHSIPAPASQPKWEERFNAKINRKIQMYRDCPIQFNGAENIIAYIEANRPLLAGRPQCFQHGDYHIGNMMIENGRLMIIDFDRYDFGDPWEEFNRIVWCAQVSPPFASGMVDGYFQSDDNHDNHESHKSHIPAAFWKLLALYIGSNTLSSLPWAVPYGEEEIETMLQQAKDVLSWYDDMKNPVPSWYSEAYHT